MSSCKWADNGPSSHAGTPPTGSGRNGWAVTLSSGCSRDNGLLSRECGGGSIHASPRMPRSPRVSALEVMMGTPFTVSATSRKAFSLSGDSKTKRTRGRRPSWSRSAHPLSK